MIRSTIRMVISPDQQTEALEILGPMKEQIQFESGCINSRLYRDVEDVRAILLEELWSSDEAVKRHLRSDTYRKILLVIEMAVEPPEIRFDTIVQSGGLEMIEQARSID